MSSEWCQNKKCPEKKTQGQIRGKKGAKYYQSNKANWYGYWCSMGCREQWFNDNKDVCIQAVGLIDKQVLPLDDAWYVEYRYDWREEERNRYHLVNKLKGVDQSITQQQAQTPEQIANNHNWYTINDTQAKELAVTLGLAS
ncbi:MAG: hypothetical protein HKN40_07100 [Winogradskyella sp.]|uniref:hypothetical protein n=1 Tax=Winogradskyella sp. TaxID=1883156 RepID=UPI0017A0B431|nr:hypothetical protein [Winogradskyella sp.]